MAENERYTGWVYDVAYSFKDYAGEATAVTELIRKRKPEASSLLDVGCGTGKHLEHFKEAFDHVEGLDLTSSLLTEARRRLLDVPFHEGDMRSFDLGRTFDAVVCLFSAIGHLLTLEDLEMACAAMARHLAPGGVLVIEPWLSPEVWDELNLHMLTVDQPDVKLARATLPSTRGDNNEISVLDLTYLVATRGKVETFQERHELRLTSEAEFLSALSKAGLDATFEPEGLRMPSQPSSRGLYIGIKPT
jgi:ubiquinone/menaquinone biosynthesis C-methylase UbiE